RKIWALDFKVPNNIIVDKINNLYIGLKGKIYGRL
ncbi:MAG: hypothetical protein ACJAR8_002069, partial [Bacteroidia bacterium]